MERSGTDVVLGVSSVGGVRVVGAASFNRECRRAGIVNASGLNADTPAIPRSTNWIEGYFSRLKPRYRQHRGLAPDKRANYFAWYFHLCRT